LRFQPLQSTPGFGSLSGAKISKEREGSELCSAILISVATCVHGATRIYERTLAHENIRKQGKFPNIAETSLTEENTRGHFFPSEEKVQNLQQ
jgi:hypothetical protein